MKYCTQCGAERKSKAKFCHVCGERFADVDPEKVMSAEWDDVEVDDSPKGGRRDTKYMLLPLIFVPFLVGIFYLLSLRSQNPDEHSGAPAGGQNDMAQMAPVFQQIDSLRGVIQENPADTTALIILGQMYEIAQNYDEARAFYTQYLQYYPKRPHIMLRTLGTYLLQHKHEQADSVIDAILAVKPNDGLTYMHIGEHLERAGDTAKAREFYGKSLELQPGRTDILIRLASTHFNDKNYAEAEGLLKQVLTKEPNNPHALYNYAFTLHMSGDNDGAITYWKKALESDPNGEIGKYAKEALAAFEKNPNL